MAWVDGPPRCARFECVEGFSQGQAVVFVPVWRSKSRRVVLHFGCWELEGKPKRWRRVTLEEFKRRLAANVGTEQ